MKHLLLATALAGIFINATAQVSFGPIAGMHMTHCIETATGYPTLGQTRKDKLNWKVGGMTSIQLYKKMCLQPALLYVRNDFGVSAFYGNDGSIKFSMIEIPVNVAYKLRVGGGKLIVSAGPYASYLLNNYTTYITFAYSGSGISIRDIPLYRRTAFGGNANIGYETNNGIMLQLHFQRLGTNLYSEELKKTTHGLASQVYLAYYNYGVTVGFLFKTGKKKKKEIQPERS